MTPEDRAKIKAVRLCGSKTADYLELIGVPSFDALADTDPYDLRDRINARLGRQHINASGVRAFENLVETAQRKRRTAPPVEITKFVRFRLDGMSHNSGAPTGIFQGAYKLRDDHDVSEVHADRLRELLNWFDEHLEEPARLNRSHRPNRTPKAISWFKIDAIEHLARAQEIAEILKQNGINVREITTIRPGYVVYEDPHQIAAEPFKDTIR